MPMTEGSALDISPDLLTRLSKGGDTRLLPARSDLAASALEGQVEAGRFVKGRPATMKDARAAIRASPDPSSQQVSEILFGESIIVFEQRGAWMWGQATVDGYVGYVPASAISFKRSEPTHRVCTPLCHIYPEPDLKTPPRVLLPMAARVTLTESVQDHFSEIEGLGWAPTGHLLPVTGRVSDFAQTALSLIGAPYLWGGRTALGIDCSGLVQIALALAGHAVARDSDMQEKSIGSPVRDSPENVSAESWRRGDIVFFPDHVGIMVDEVSIIHANATHMMVSVEPLIEVISRLRKKHPQPVSTVRRVS